MIIYIPAKAEVRIGTSIIKTPFIQSVNIKRGRGQVSRASVMLRLSNSSEEVAIGIESQGVQIRYMNQNVFTGIVISVNATASGECAGEVILSITAEDQLYKLRGKRFTRRQKLNGIGPLAMITSIENRPFVAFDDPPSLYDIERTASPLSVLTPTPNFRKLDMLLDSGQGNSNGSSHPTIQLSDKMPYIGGAGTGGGGLILHTHEDSSLGRRGGGVSFSSFSAK